MDPRGAARAIAAGRVLFGAACIAAPRVVLGPAARRSDDQMVWMARAFGVRDVVLGAGALVNLLGGEDHADAARQWVAVGAIADTADLANAVIFRDELGPRGVLATIALALPAAAGGWWARIGLRPA